MWFNWKVSFISFFYQIMMSYIVSLFPFVLFFSVLSLSFVLSVKKSCLEKN